MHATRRTHHRRLAAVAAAAALALTLTACGSDDAGTDASPTATSSADASAAPTDGATAAATPSAEDIAALEAVVVEGDPGSQPTITLPDEPSPFTVSANVARVVTEGDGEAIEVGDILETQLTAVDSSGEKLGSTYEDEASQPWTVGTQLPALDDALASVNIGAQVLLALTSGDDTALYVFEPVGKIPSRASGTAVDPVEGLPTVTLADDGAPTIEPSDADAPTELVAQTLIEGDGKTVEAGDSIMVQYTGALWDGTVFDSSWTNGQPFSVENVGQAQVIDGWNEGLVGQKVGSQVLLVVPPDKGYGDADQGSIPANSTLVFVVDILFAS